MRKFFLLIICFFQPLLADFNWDLFHSAVQTDKNTVFSPYSIYISMSMTAAGASNGTLDEFQKVLHLPSDISPDLIKMANTLWVAPQFFILADFRKTIEDDFHGSVQSVDFANPPKAASTINEWIAEHTDQKITQLITSHDLQASTRMVLTNATYFKGNFLKPFNRKLTTPQPFWVDADTNIETPMMEQTAFFSYSENETFQILAMPFEKSTAALVLFLPKSNTFTHLASQMTSEKFQSAIDALGLRKVHVQMPKFSLKQRLDLNHVLSEMGIKTAFTFDADFSRIDGKKDLYLSKVLHEAFISVDENGVVAAAATSASFNIKSVAEPDHPIEFNADHPFIFALVDLDSRTPLFLGELITPQ